MPERTKSPEANPPLLTMLSTGVMLLLFAVLAIVIYGEIEKRSEANKGADPAAELQKLRAEQQQRLSSYGYDEANKASFMPIDQAIERRANRGVKP